MTKSEIVETLRCAADLCWETIVPVRAACLMTGASMSVVVPAFEAALGRPRSRDVVQLHVDLLEAAQRIEESK